MRAFEAWHKFLGFNDILPSLDATLHFTVINAFIVSSLLASSLCVKKDQQVSGDFRAASSSKTKIIFKNHKV